MATTDFTFYRPIWTCGRYSAKGNCAIFYNLLSGESYYFEDDSAEVICEILKYPRNGVVNTEEICSVTNTSFKSMEDFFNQLFSVGLLCDRYPDETVISKYRDYYATHRERGIVNSSQSTSQKLHDNFTGETLTEGLYDEKAGGVTYVMFELTYNCSEKCIHCYNPGATRNDFEKSARGNRQELTFSDYKKVIDELYENGVYRVCLSGGDPFSNPYAWDIIEYLYDKGIATDIYTNGQKLVGKEEKLANYYPRLVGVSIYSGEEHDHDAITRVPGSWRKSMNIIKELSKFSVPLNLKCCVMTPNVKTYYKVADLAEKYGAVPQFDVVINDSLDGDKCATQFLRLPEDLLEIVLRDKHLSTYVGNEFLNYGAVERDTTKNVCYAGYHSFCITPEGNVKLCCSFPLILGNIKDDCFSKIIDHELLEKWKQTKLEDYVDCGKHNYCSFCILCPGNNFNSNKSPLVASENNCYVARVRYNLAEKMKSNNYDPLHGMTLEAKLASLPEYVPQRLKRLIE